MPAITRDPVCHMEVAPEQAATSRRSGEETYWFCSSGCAEQFERDPTRYLSAPLPERSEYQLIIIGGGPAGLTAALYAAIHRLRTLLIADDIGGQALESVDMRNYMGFQVIEGRDLIDRFRHQLLHSNFVDHRLDRTTSLVDESGRFHITTERGGRYASEAVILATGMKNRLLGVPGEERLLHRGVSFSVVQDAEQFHGCDVAIVGGGNSGLQAANRLAPIVERLFLISNGALTGDGADIDRARALPNLTILEHASVHEVLGADRVEGIRVTPTGSAEEVIPVSGVFVEIGYVPNSSLAVGLADLNSRGEIVIADDCSTRTEGLIAAGDVTSAFGKRVIVACGEGAKAALSAYQYLTRKREKVSPVEYSTKILP
jgi:NADH-dependent peroxiredoxin subunit F